jgi:hypothetical protein
MIEQVLNMPEMPQIRVEDCEPRVDSRQIETFRPHLGCFLGASSSRTAAALVTLFALSY